MSAVPPTHDAVPAEDGESARTPTPRASSGRASSLVAAGILFSRIFGLVRQRVLSRYLGLSMAADAWNAAFRIPNFLQNLFGEGVLSASFIPVYARLLAERDEAEADRVAGAVFALLAVAVAVLVLVGIIFAAPLVVLVASGFSGEKRELTIRLVRVLFPGAALLVLSAWCLGVLNSHRHFLLSYSAPVVWNAAIIVALLAYGRRVGQMDLAVVAAWGSVIGSALTFAVQLPAVLKLLGRLPISFGVGSPHVHTVVRNFFPVFLSRGVVQISAWVDTLLASYLPTGAVSGLMSAQTLYTLPVSLFGMSVSAAELPTMSAALGEATEVARYLRERLEGGLHRIALLVIPSAMAFFALGDVLAGAIFQTGRFTRADSLYVWGILAGSAVGLLASTLGRLYASTFYALRDTRTPLRFAVVRVALTSVLGYLFAIPLPPFLGLDPRWGAAGLTASAGLAGWVEFALLRRSLNARIGQTGLSVSYTLRLWLAAAVGAAGAWGIKLALGASHPIILALVACSVFGVIYFGVAAVLGVRGAGEIVGRTRGLLRRS